MLNKIPAVRIPELVKGLKEYLVSFGYKERTLRQFDSVWNGLLTYATNQGEEYFSMELGREFLKDNYGITIGLKLPSWQRCKIRPIQLISDYQLHGTISLYRKNKNYIWPVQFREVFESFIENYSTRQLDYKTLNQVRLNVEQFATYLNDNGIRDFSEITVSNLHKFIQTLAKYSQGSIAYALRVLRKLFDYTYQSGFHLQNLSSTITSFRYDKKSKIPSAYTVDEVQRLLSAVDRGSPVGKRNYAILLLAAKLGIRSGDIRNLKLENLKWDTHRIELIQKKTGQVLNLPILNDIGFAIIDYLKYGRPQTKLQHVFLRHNAPHDKMSGTGLYDIITKYMRLAKIRVPKGKKH